MNLLPPLLLDRSCLVEKMKVLSPLIDQLEWINTNDKAFRAYWNYYANGCKKRQQNIRQRIEQNADFVQHIKSKKAASFLKILTQEKPQLFDQFSTPQVSMAEAPNKIYEDFLGCFQRPVDTKSKEKRRKRHKQTVYAWKSEVDETLKRLRGTRNPYDVAAIKDKLKKLEQVHSMNQPAPYSLRFSKPSIKYEASTTKPPSVEAEMDTELDKSRSKLRSRISKRTKSSKIGKRSKLSNKSIVEEEEPQLRQRSLTDSKQPSQTGGNRKSEDSPEKTIPPPHKISITEHSMENFAHEMRERKGIVYQEMPNKMPSPVLSKVGPTSINLDIPLVTKAPVEHKEKHKRSKTKISLRSREKLPTEEVHKEEQTSKPPLHAVEFKFKQDPVKWSQTNYYARPQSLASRRQKPEIKFGEGEIIEEPQEHEENVHKTRSKSKEVPHRSHKRSLSKGRTSKQLPQPEKQESKTKLKAKEKRKENDTSLNEYVLNIQEFQSQPILSGRRSVKETSLLHEVTTVMRLPKVRNLKRLKGKLGIRYKPMQKSTTNLSPKTSYLPDDSEDFLHWYKEFSYTKAKHYKNRLKPVKTTTSSLNDTQSLKKKRKRLRKDKDLRPDYSYLINREPNFEESPPSVDQAKSENKFKFMERSNENTPSQASELYLKHIEAISDLSGLVGKMRDSRLQNIQETDGPVLEPELLKTIPKATLIPKFVRYPREGKIRGASTESKEKPKLLFKGLKHISKPDFYHRKSRRSKRNKSETSMKTDTDKLDMIERRQSSMSQSIHDSDRRSASNTPRTYRSSQSAVVHDMSKWDLLFRNSSQKSNMSIKSSESKDSEASKADVDLQRAGFKLNFLGKGAVYNKPYSRHSFIDQITDAFGQASQNIKSEMGRKSMASRISATSTKALYGSRSRTHTLDHAYPWLPPQSSKLKNSISRQFGTTQRFLDPKPLWISDLISEFLKSRSIEDIFKNTNLKMLGLESESFSKDGKPLIQRKSHIRRHKRPGVTEMPVTPTKTCIDCHICRQLKPKPSKHIQPYMLKMQCQRKKNELRLYYKQMMQRNAMREKHIEAQRVREDTLCPSGTSFHALMAT